MSLQLTGPHPGLLKDRLKVYLFAVESTAPEKIKKFGQYFSCRNQEKSLKSVREYDLFQIKYQVAYH